MQKAIATLERNGIKFEIVVRTDYEKIVLTEEYDHIWDMYVDEFEDESN